MTTFLSNELSKPKPPKPPPTVAGDKILVDLLSIYDRLVLEPNYSKDEELQHENMIDLCDQLIVARYLYVFNKQQDPIDSVDFKPVEFGKREIRR